MPLESLNYWMLHDDRLARELDTILKFSPGYDPLRCVPAQPDLSFFASLVSDVDSFVGQISGVFARASEGLYLAPRGHCIAIAGNDVSRHEYSESDQPIGILMEPDVENKNANFNANPDPDLRAIVHDGRCQRVLDVDTLLASGLNVVCNSGYVFEVDNLSHGTSAQVWITPDVGNTNRHSCSVYARKDLNSQNRTFLELEAINSIEFTNTDKYQRIILIDDPPFSTRRLGIIVEPFSRAWFVINQLEEISAPTSPIITRGSASPRARDTLQWPLIDINGERILTDSEGMAAFVWRPRFSSNQINNQGQTVSLSFLQTLSITSSPFAMFVKDLSDNNAFVTNIGTDQASVSVSPNINRDEDYLVQVLWGAGELQIGYKHQGVVTWGPAQSYSSGFSDDGFLYLRREASAAMDLSSNFRNLYLWRTNEGRDWLEGFFSDTAS